MNNHIAGKNRAKHLQRILAVLITAALFTVTIPTSSVSAYYTSGANGRSLEVIPGFTVNQLLAPAGTACREQQMLRSFTGVTIHETSNWSGGATARMHALYLWDAGRNNDVSWHYVVDNTTAYQCIPESEKSWHAGDTANGVGNASTISIEICDNSNGNFDQAMANAEWLAADVLYRHGVYSVSGALFQHHDFSAFGKNCPITIRDTGRWGEFCGKTQMYLDRMTAANGRFYYTNSSSDTVITCIPSNTDSVSRVDFYTDANNWVGSAPKLTDGSISYTVDAAFFSAGWHDLRIAVIYIDGSVKWISNSILIGPPSQICLDAPSGDAMIGGDLTISGWAVSHAGISRVDIYMDDYQWIGSTPNMYERSDVNIIVNSSGLFKNGLNSGFSYTIDASLMRPGIHVVKVAAISRDGTAQWTAKTITVGPVSQIYLDTPSSETVIGGNVTVSGWAVSHAGISRVDIYMDDYQWIGSTPNMYERSDVNSIINSSGLYKNALNSGFSYTIDASLMTPGTHVVKVAAVSRDGTAQWTEKTITVGPASRICLDAPSGDAMIGGDLTVSGWAVSHAGISRVDIYIDDYQWIGSTPNMYERSDVNSIINSSGLYMNGLNSGFSYTIDASLMTPGTHVVKVAAVSRDGTAQWTQKTITVGPASRICLDAPSGDAMIDGDLTVSGWAVSRAGISRVDIYMDDYQWIGSTPNMYERADVNNIVNSSGLYKNGLNSGFSYTIDASLMTPGTHVVKVAAISRDGTAQWTQKTFTVNPAV